MEMDRSRTKCFWYHEPYNGTQGMRRQISEKSSLQVETLTREISTSIRQENSKHDMRSSQFNIISFSCNFLFTEKAKEWIDPGPSPLYKIKSIVSKYESVTRYELHFITTLPLFRGGKYYQPQSIRRASTNLCGCRFLVKMSPNCLSVAIFSIVIRPRST